MRRTATSGKGRVMRRRRDSGWSVIVCEMGLGIDVGKRFITRPQTYFLLGDAIADDGFRLILHLHTGRQQSMRQTRRPPGTPGTKPGLRW